jgi:basic membrane protein A and related proteins
MKKLGLALLVPAVVFTVFALIGCEAEQAEDDGSLRVVLYVNGTLGDRSFFDSAHRGLQQAMDEFGVVGRTIEGSYDPANWEPDLRQLAADNWDIIIAGTWQLAEYVQELAVEYPDKYFITYDTSVDYSSGDQGNVYSILYSQNEGSFLAGALAGLLTSSDLPLARSDQKTIGVVGGMDIPVINDFIVGYEQGAKTVDPDVRVLVSYVGNFNDPARGKELALAQIDQGADVVFGVAGESGLGVIDAAAERGRMTLGVDSDQYLLFKESDPQKASHIVTSMMKNVDLSIYRAIELHLAGELGYGEAEVLGIEQGGVGLAENERYLEFVPDQFRTRVQELAAQVTSGQIVVDTALGN